jgi:hypothetical protein
MAVEVDLIREPGSLASYLITSNPIYPRHRCHWRSEPADFLKGCWMGDDVMGTKAVARAAWTTGFLFV